MAVELCQECLALGLSVLRNIPVPENQQFERAAVVVQPARFANKLSGVDVRYFNRNCCMVEAITKFANPQVCRWQTDL